MSIPIATVQYIFNNLNGRYLLTFNVNNPTIKAVLPVCCLFHDPSSPQLPPTYFAPDYFQKNPQNAGSMYVYNSTTKRVETMDQTYCLTQIPLIDSDPLFAVQAHPIASKTTSLPGEQFTLTSTGIQLTSPSSGKAAQMVRYDDNWFDFCMAAGSTAYPAFCTPNINLINAMTYDELHSKVQSVQFADLCCSGLSGDAMTDFSYVLLAFLSWTKPYNNGQAQSTLSPFQYPVNCQFADEKCSCPQNNTCFVSTGDTGGPVPCCISANPKDPIFQGVMPAVITHDPIECQNASPLCNQWSYSADVPCCVQRSTAQWNAAGYSPPLGYFVTKAECDAAAAAAGSCTYQNLLTPSASKDYYKLILESKYTSGCDPLRTGGIWGTSANCDSDPNPVACETGNCTQNFCAPWIVSTSNPYMFSQKIKCLPTPSACCTGGKKQVINNPGQYNVFSSCQ